VGEWEALADCPDLLRIEEVTSWVDHDEVVEVAVRGTVVATGEAYELSCVAVLTVDVADIAAVGDEALTAADPPQADLVVTGPEVLTYDEVAATISEVSGRPVAHRKVDEPAFAQWLTGEGVPAPFAAMDAALDAALATGTGDHVGDVVERTTERRTGRSPRSFRDLAAEHWS
jgi:uncharacterized protein YbjT (DUF2867 family)